MTESRTTEQQLLSVYQKVNPSTYHIETDDEEFHARESFFSGLVHRRLCFPKKMFQGAEMIEFGSGTGEHSLFYLLWGAYGTFVEINEKAIERMQSLFQHFQIPDCQYNAIEQSVFDFQPDRTWDIVATMGVLHHLEDKEKAFSKVASCVAPGGYLLFGIANKAGSLQRNLQRLIVHTLAGDDHDKIEQVAELLFTEHLDRAERFGRRTRKAIIYDTYVNPKIDGMSVAEVFDQFAENGLEPYSMWPPTTPALLGDSPNRPACDHMVWPAINGLAELGWLAHRDDDAELLHNLEQQLKAPMKTLDELTEAFNDQDAEQHPDLESLQSIADAAHHALSKPVDPYTSHWQLASQLMTEINEVLALLAERDIDALRHRLASCEVLFRGTSGLGMSYYIAHRPDTPPTHA